MLATHVLRLRGTDTEKAALDAIVGASTPDHPVAGFPTPCSVGLSVFCENGATLLLVRRSRSAGAGGYWEPGSVFNAVGENANLSDFTSSNRHANESSPSVIARRGLYQELGLSDTDISASDVRLHSFAWASDLLDFKFFGHVVTPLSYSEVQSRWREAPDRSETTGAELIRWPVQSLAECRRVLTAIRDNPDRWSPEAIFSTVRSLVTLRRITINDVVHLVPNADHDVN
jgi:hypothetical protein